MTRASRTYRAVSALLDDAELFSRAGIRTHPLRSYQL